MKRSLMVFIGIFVSGASLGADQITSETTISKIYTYTQYGGGDALVIVANPATNCADGFWLAPADAGSKSTLSSLIAAYHARSKVRIVASDTSLWPGSSTGTFCRILSAIVQI